MVMAVTIMCHPQVAFPKSTPHPHGRGALFMYLIANCCPPLRVLASNSSFKREGKRVQLSGMGP